MAEEPSLAQLLRGLLREGGEYGRDLARMFTAELRQHSRVVRTRAAMGAAALLLLLTSFLILSAALVGLVSWLLDSWRWALLIVGGTYVAGAGLLGAAVARSVRQEHLRFEHTRQRLRRDAEWLKQKLAA